MQVSEVKSFFEKSLWDKAKTLKNIENYKRIWNKRRKGKSNGHIKKLKPHTKMKKWLNEDASTWYFSITDKLKKPVENKIFKKQIGQEVLMCWAILTPSLILELKLGDLAFMPNLIKKNQSKIKVLFVRIKDKSKVETEQGDFHFAFETEERTYPIGKSRFDEMLENAKIALDDTDFRLNQNQIQLMKNILSSSSSKK